MQTRGLQEHWTELVVAISFGQGRSSKADHFQPKGNLEPASMCCMFSALKAFQATEDTVEMLYDLALFIPF